MVSKIKKIVEGVQAIGYFLFVWLYTGMILGMPIPLLIVWWNNTSPSGRRFEVFCIYAVFLFLVATIIHMPKLDRTESDLFKLGGWLLAAAGGGALIVYWLSN